jgi:hypothetical protein
VDGIAADVLRAGSAGRSGEGEGQRHERGDERADV